MLTTTPTRSVSTLLSLITLLALTQCQPKLPPGDPGNGGLYLPDHFEAVVVVDSLPARARQLAVNTNGDIYVKSRFSKKDARNVALRDTNNDGKADVIEEFGSYEPERSYGTAMRVHNGYLYLSSELTVYRYKLTPGKLTPQDSIEAVVIDDHEHGMHEHIAKPICFDNKGNIYVPYGAPSNSCQEMNRTPRVPGIDPCPQLELHGGVWKFDANKINQTQKDGVKFATGIRSVVAMDWNSEDENLYLVMHGRDDLLRLWPNLYSPWQSAVLPSEEFMKVKEGDDYGWPYCYYDQMQEKKVLAPEYGGDGKITGRCDQFQKPLMGFPGHWAPNDLLFYKGKQFPERYTHGAFVAFHGSTNRAPYPQSGYIIAYIPFENNKPTGAWEVFADGFAVVDPVVDVSDATYRPMGLAEGPDGSLYISDTEKGKIWRVMYKGDINNFGTAELAAMEKRKSASNIRNPDPVKDNLNKGEAVGGQKTFELYCATCHQKNGKGASGRFPSLVNTEWVLGDKKRLIGIVLNGMEGNIEVNGENFVNAMPQHSFLSDEDVAKVLTYVRESFGNKASAVETAEVTAVRKKTATK
ncbi:c-type cytochrome [Chryseolinea lacunae]|uniref:PQQ-dependent sugar dehydrogenase n=1 Tax=Chryseolinea lacunae TaxID=2801331 RepID=A0ABS1KX13_9BACT|nr:c-type cytochrome [Chryseolinea lacunae]MBL0743995.1 PQQ-dependent sugar dehydrogenase [Chryseolinea lacunae]